MLLMDSKRRIPLIANIRFVACCVLLLMVCLTAAGNDSNRRHSGYPSQNNQQHQRRSPKANTSTSINNSLEASGMIGGTSAKIKSSGGTNGGGGGNKFSCADLPAGHYADPKHHCRVYHVCNGHGRKQTFKCPEGTSFDQEAQKCDHPVRPECIREPSEKSSSRVSHSSSETHSSTQQQQQQQKHSAGKNSRKRPHQQITEDRANQRNAPSASPQQQQKQHRQHHHNQQQQQQQKHQMSPQQKVESRAAATSTLDADVEALHGRRSYSLQAQARTPALFSQGLIQPGPGRDEIDFPDDFYDEFVPKQETDVPDVQEFLEPQYNSYNKPGNANNNKRQQVPQNRPNSLEASSYPIGFQPNQTPFRPIPRPAGLPIMTSSEEDRSPPTSTSHPSQQKQQAKFTLSDARAAMLLLNNNNQNNNSPASAFGKDSGSSSLETETMFYPVLKPGYNGPSAVVRHHKKTQGKSPGIKNQQRPNNDEGSWQQEVSSEAPVSSQGSQSIFGKGAGSGSLEDEEDSSEPGRPLTRKHNIGNNNKRMFGGARHPEYKQQVKITNIQDEPRDEDIRGPPYTIISPNSDSSEDPEEEEEEPQEPSSPIPRNPGRKSSGNYESHRIRQKIRQESAFNSNPQPQRHRAPNHANKGRHGGGNNSRRPPAPTPPQSSGSSSSAHRPNGDEWALRGSNNNQQQLGDPVAAQEPGVRDEEISEPDSGNDYEDEGSQRRKTPSAGPAGLPAFEFNFGFQGPEFEPDEDYQFADADEETPSSPSGIHSPHGLRKPQPPPPPPSRRQPAPSRPSRPALEQNFKRPIVPSIPIVVAQDLPEVVELPNLVPDIEYVSFLPPPTSLDQNPPSTPSRQHNYVKDHHVNTHSYSDHNNARDKADFGPDVPPRHGFSEKPGKTYHFPQSAFSYSSKSKYNDPEPIKPDEKKPHRFNSLIESHPETPGSTHTDESPHPVTEPEPAHQAIPEKPVPPVISAIRQRVRNRLPSTENKSKSSISFQSVTTTTSSTVRSQGMSTTSSPAGSLTTPTPTVSTSTTPRPSRASAFERYKNLRQKYLSKFKPTRGGSSAEDDSDDHDGKPEVSVADKRRDDPQPRPNYPGKTKTTTTASPTTTTTTPTPPQAITSPNSPLGRTRFAPTRGPLRRWKPQNSAAAKPGISVTSSSSSSTQASPTAPQRPAMSARERLQGMYRRKTTSSSSSTSTTSSTTTEKPEVGTEYSVNVKPTELRIESIDIGGPIDSGALESPVVGNTADSSSRNNNDDNDGHKSGDHGVDDSESRISHDDDDNDDEGSSQLFEDIHDLVAQMPLTSEPATERGHKTKDQEGEEEEDGDDDDDENGNAEENRNSVDASVVGDSTGVTTTTTMKTDSPEAEVKQSSSTSVPFPSFATQEPVLPLQSLFSVDFK